MTVFLSVTDPGGGAEALWGDPEFLIKGPPTADGLEVYYRTRALEKYVVPVAAPAAGLQSATTFFNEQSAGSVYLAVLISDTAAAVAAPLAQTVRPS
jgi:hypothetical protein